MKYLFAGLAMLLLAVLGWVLSAQQGQPQSADVGKPPPALVALVSSASASTATNAGPPLAAHSGQAPGATPASPASGDQQDQPLPTGDFDLIRPQLERLAMAGDGQASARLANIYLLCGGKRAADSELHLPSGLRELLTPEELERHKDTVRIGSGCADLGEINVPDYQDQYWKWLERAAELGDVGALMQYANSVIKTWPAVEGRERRGPNWPSALGDAERIIHYRDKAVGFLERAFDLGASYALYSMAIQFGPHGDLFPPDPVRAYAYALAFRAAADTAFSRTHAVALLAWLGHEVTNEQIAQARLLSGDILADFYDGAD